jgi:aldose sugar dehydrogenase
MKSPPRCIVLVLAAVASVAGQAAAQTLQTREVVAGLSTPWEILWGPDGWIWMTERGGRVSRVDPENGTLVPIITITVVDEAGESGLLGMTVKGDSVFVVYTYLSGTTRFERLVRYRYDGVTLVAPTILIDSIVAPGTHSGSRLVITPDSRLMMTTGDGAVESNVQSHSSLNGKVLRMNLDGSIPADNPFASAPHPSRLIWTTGHRNAQGLVLGPNGILYSSEHGATTNDEINIIERKRNYGWPVVEGFCDLPAEIQLCRDSNVAEPIKAWTPTIATCGLEYYGHSRIPSWQHSLILTTLAQSDVRILTLSGDGRSIVRETVYDDPLFARVRDVCVAPDGRVFVATIDRIVEIAPRPGDLTLEAPTIEASQVRAGEPYRVRFSAHGTAAPGNVFHVELVGPRGTIALATASDTGDYVVDGVFKCRTTGGGSGYRLRLRSDYPLQQKFGNGDSMTFVASRRASITAPPGEVLCAGDTAVLIGVAGVVNRWSTGDTSETLRVTAAGKYRLTIIDGTCTDSTTSTVAFAARPTPDISWIPNWGMFSTAAGFPGYQWLRNGEVMPGETTRHLVPPPGLARYSVRVTSSNRCTGTSEELLYVPAASPEATMPKTPTIELTYDRPNVVIKVEPYRPTDFDIAIIDMRGSVVRVHHEELASAPLRIVMPAGDLIRGTYIVQISSDSFEWSEKVSVD